MLEMLLAFDSLFQRDDAKIYSKWEEEDFKRPLINNNVICYIIQWTILEDTI